MCGIVGVVHLNGQPIDRATLWRMTNTLAHRGPDAQGVELLEEGTTRVGLGHTRLKVIDLSETAAQPMSNEDRSVAIVFNGEIYNYRILRRMLESRGIRFQSSSDTEVILRLYEAEGTQGIAQLDGMFAIGIWDRTRGQLLLVRDRLGKKPLFYWPQASTFSFASEIKALLAQNESLPEINREVLPAFFLYGYVPTPHTMYRGIMKLPAGHLLRLSADGQIYMKSYWDVPLHEEQRESQGSDRQMVQQVRELVTDAVRRRLIADVPIGAFLSGGIDSSIVVGLMSRLMDRPVQTFSIGFTGDARFNETSYARLASAQFHTAHTEFVVEPKAVELVERLVWHHDGPFADSSAIPTYLLSRLAREHVTVALNGDGGDELFAGYLRFYAAIICERIPLSARVVIRNVLRRLPPGGGHRSFFQRLQKFSGSAVLPLIERYSRWIAVFYEDLNCLFPGQESERLVMDSLRFLEPSLKPCEGLSPLSTLLYVNLKTYLLDDLLVKMDRCSMAHALETRSPFLDRALMEYVFTLPDRMKLRWGRTKVILRQAFADLLPPAILRRGKMGFGVPLRAWFTTDLRDYIQDLLLAPDARLRGFMSQEYVQQLWNMQQAGQADYSHRLWTLLTFEVWLRQLPIRTSAPVVASVLND